MAHASRSVWLLAGLLAPLALLGLTGDPGVLSTARLIGAGTADTFGHTWGYAWAAQALQQGQLPILNAPLSWPMGQTWWIIDLPVALLLAPVTWLGSAAASYHAAFLLHAAVGAAGIAAWLQRRAVGAVHCVAAGALAAISPFVRGAAISGVPEALSVLLLPLWMILLEDGLGGARRALFGAAALGALIVLDGAYGAISVALVGITVSLGAIGQARARRRVLLRAAIAGLPAVICALGVRAFLRATAHPVMLNVSQRRGGIDGDWVMRPIGGVDLASFVLPASALPVGTPPTDHRHIVYVGFIAIIAAGIATWRRREARPLAIIAASAGVLSLGATLQLYGTPLLTALPGALLQAGGAMNLYRVAGLIPVMLVLMIAIALGAPGRSRRWALIWLLIGAEWLLGAPIPTMLPTVANPANTVEAWLANQPEPGAVLDLPTDRGVVRPPEPHPQRTFFLQSVHRRPIASGMYQRPSILDHAPRIRHFTQSIDRMLKQEAPGYRDHKRTVRLPPAPSEGSARQIHARLRAQGFAYVTLDLHQLPDSLAPSCQAWIEALLGPPAIADHGRLAWPIPHSSQSPPKSSLEPPR